MRLAKTFLESSWCHGEQEPVTEHQGVAAVLQQLSPPPGLPASGVLLRAYWRFCRENPQQSRGNTCFVFFSKTTAVLAGGTGAIQRQQVTAGGGPLPQALRHLLAPARIWALNSRSTKSWQMLKRQRPRSKARLLLQEESGWQTASCSCAWGRERLQAKLQARLLPEQL